MTADRPATEPRPAYVRARQFYNERHLPQPYYDLLDDAVAEAAQGAAPRAEGLDVFDNLLRHHNATCPRGWTCEFAKAANARLSRRVPAERLDVPRLNPEEPTDA